MALTGFTKEAEDIVEQRIHPIVEFFPIDFGHDRQTDFIDTAAEDRQLLRSALKSAKGIYVFYNSEYEIIYLGKTKSDLWVEMKNAYGRQMTHYGRYRTHQPRGKYATSKDGKLRPIRRHQMYLADCATYFSAYAFKDDTLIDVVELLMIRVFPNDILNVRMEGNTALQPYVRAPA